MADGTIGNPDIELPEHLTDDLIDLVRGLEFSSAPQPVQRRIRHSLMDTIGVTALGAELPPVQILKEVVLHGGVAGPSRVFGAGHERTGPMDAALINGDAGHVCDFDDSGAGGHTSSIIVPALLALVDVADVSGEELLSAMFAGYETAYRINSLVTNHHYYMGFHSSGTLGTFGSVAASARLLGLDHRQWSYTFGVAESLASGLLANFGSMVKGFHAGSAARNGVISALLGEKGFHSSTEVLEADGGFVTTHTTKIDGEGILAPIGEPYAVSNLMYKFNACCWGTHSGPDGVRRLMRENGVEPDEIERITVTVPKIQYEVANIPEPQTVWEAKFSVRWTTAAGALGINTAERFPDDDREITAPEVTAMLQRVEIRAMKDVVHGGAADIVMELKSGKRLETSLNSMAVIDDLDEEGTRLSAKFVANATALYGQAAADAAVPRLLSFEREPSVRGFLDDLGI